MRMYGGLGPDAQLSRLSSSMSFNYEAGYYPGALSSSAAFPFSSERIRVVAAGAEVLGSVSEDYDEPVVARGFVALSPLSELVAGGNASWDKGSAEVVQDSQLRANFGLVSSLTSDGGDLLFGREPGLEYFVLQLAGERFTPGFRGPVLEMATLGSEFSSVTTGLTQPLARYLVAERGAVSEIPNLRWDGYAVRCSSSEGSSPVLGVLIPDLKLLVFRLRAGARAFHQSLADTAVLLPIVGQYASGSSGVVVGDAQPAAAAFLSSSAGELASFFLQDVYSLDLAERSVAQSVDFFVPLPSSLVFSSNPTQESVASERGALTPLSLPAEFDAPSAVASAFLSGTISTPVTFLTSVGLLNERGDLLGVGRFSSPRQIEFRSGLQPGELRATLAGEESLTLRVRLTAGYTMPRAGSARSSTTSLVVVRPTVYPYTASAGQFVEADASSGAVSVLMPASPSAGDRINVKKVDASGYAVTVDGNGNTIDGSTTFLLSALNDVVTLVFGTTQWLIE